MGGLEGYTGPTSGRIRIPALNDTEGELVVERFYDRPLTREERDAVAWFTALSPHEQLREVRRLKFNLESAQTDRDKWKDVARRADAVNGRLTVERDARRPDGYELPRSAAELLSLAAEKGWKTARGWYLDEDGSHASLGVRIGRDGWEFQLRWGVPRDGNGAGSLVRAGLARRPGRSWYDAPSLKEIKRIITETF